MKCQTPCLIAKTANADLQENTSFSRILYDIQERRQSASSGRHWGAQFCSGGTDEVRRAESRGFL